MKSWRHFLFAISSLVAFLTSAQPAHAQTISGTVSTTFGVPIPGVTVTAIRQFPFQRVSDATDASGNYSIGRILGDLDGTYNVQASAPGYIFTPASTNVTLSRIGGVTVNFTTPATVPTVETLAASNVLAATAVLNGRARPNGASTIAWFEYGVTTAYGSVTTSGNFGAGNAFAPFSRGLGGLQSNTNYHFRLVGSNTLGITYGEDQTFTTMIGIPLVSTQLPTEGGATSMRLNGTVDANGAVTRAWFEVGTTTNYEFPSVSQPIGSNVNSVVFNQMFTELTAGTTYFYRAAAASSFGTNYGIGLIFTSGFAEIAAGLPGAARSSVAWGDYDNDGRLDLLSVGSNGPVSSVSQVWRNLGNGSFSNINAGLPGVQFASVAWCDFDNDGGLDFLLSGTTNRFPSGAICQIWRNTGDGSFSNINAGLPGITGWDNGSAVAWGDYNNDGRPDLILTGVTTDSNTIAQLWRNTDGGFALDRNVSLRGVSEGAVAWGDYDNDARLDFLLTGNADGALITQLWRNTGDGFVNVPVSLPPLAYGSVAWGDYNNDGRLDLLLHGLSNQRITQVWRNTGANFAMAANLTGLADGSATWGDYNNDGRLDVLLTGWVWPNASTATARIFRNNAIGTPFTDIGAGLPGLFRSSAAWGDFDNDGRLDIAMSGYTFSNGFTVPITQIRKSHGFTTNTPPSPPANLNIAVSNNLATLSWAAASDTQTPAVGLTYNMRVGKTPGASDVLAPMAASSGLRTVPQLGNAQLGATAHFKFEAGTPYYWSVQAIDTAFAGSPFAAEKSFKILPVSVPVDATSLLPGDVNGDGVVSNNEFSAVLANYWTNNPWLQMTNPVKLSDGFFQFALTNEAVWNFSVEVTTNLTDWSFLGPAFPVYQFVDPSSTNLPQRYYRLLWP